MTTAFCCESSEVSDEQHDSAKQRGQNGCSGFASGLTHFFSEEMGHGTWERGKGLYDFTSRVGRVARKGLDSGDEMAMGR